VYFCYLVTFLATCKDPEQIYYVRRLLWQTCPDTIVTTWKHTIESGKNTCTYPEQTWMCPEHFLRWGNCGRWWLLGWFSLIVAVWFGYLLEGWLGCVLVLGWRNVWRNRANWVLISSSFWMGIHSCTRVATEFPPIVFGWGVFHWWVEQRNWWLG